MEIKKIAKEIHENAKQHGWWDENRCIPELLCLIHAEVSEALEAYREHNLNNFREEIADIIIRTLDLSVGLGIDIEKEIIVKHEYNKTRPYRHGNKRC